MPIYAIRSEDLYVQNAEVEIVELKVLLLIIIFIIIHIIT